ncbi:hypothetical protein COL154_001345 [Colletotrichum chrysophilum]|uniref:uncharacterized protein n=1 Tax=Colletotrichum chrysophilum TaxID=1836956 RepID=UPI0023019E47|nr:uncharacterized protein COL26b_000661 [Colletotrichum chrysophilum]KAJ0339884.1 hypothetical protein KNSL1_011816 [Colletotrichum chrysophilum]KAJ0370214.1 hypothetical protein COL154_001345 [Colletotrichum chrysophilum]KAJ0381316.1 hypothetical protein COL26b_000661 [Colletotrichum chrysophilum]
MAESSHVLAPALAAMNLDNHSPTIITAAQRALSNHLIISEIFDYISMDCQGCWKDRPAEALRENHGAVTGSTESRGVEVCDGSDEKRQDHGNTDDDDDDEEDWSVHHYCRGGVLMRCMLVNKLWFEFATPFLWKEPTEMVSYPSYKTAIVAILSAIEPVRRQMYAKHVEIGFNEGRDNEDLTELEFPRLREMQLRTDYEINLPKINGYGVKVLSVDPRYEPCYPEVYTLTQDRMNELLDQIAERFRNIESLSICDSALAYPGTMKKFKDRMPHLVDFDHSYVTEQSHSY